MKPEKAKIISTLCLIDEYAIYVTDNMKKGEHNDFKSIFRFLQDQLELFEDDYKQKESAKVEEKVKQMSEKDKLDLNKECE